MADEGLDDELAPTWLEDGHSVVVVWDRDHVRIGAVNCPNADRVSFCNRQRSFCVVQKFVEVYGFDCNVGHTVINGPVEIAWVGIEGESDLDKEWQGVWIIPIDDPDYRTAKALNEGSEL